MKNNQLQAAKGESTHGKEARPGETYPGLIVMTMRRRLMRGTNKVGEPETQSPGPSKVFLRGFLIRVVAEIWGNI